MLDETSNADAHPIVALVPTDPEWRPIFHHSNQVVLYNPTSHALSIRNSSLFPRRPRPPCPYCKQSLPLGFEPDSRFDGHDESLDADPLIYSRTSNYFHLLAIANETSSRPNTRAPTPPPITSHNGGNGRSAFPAGTMAEGYFKAFFQEEYRLGMGANGSVFLCQHMLDGNPLGHFAVKKIAVGESHSYLLNILREVRLLERLHHPNIITYHHAWLESCQFSPFGPKVPTLHVLMQWAEGGSLDDFIDVRLGRETRHVHFNPSPPTNLFSDSTSIPSHLNGTSVSSPSTPTLSPSTSNAHPQAQASPSDEEDLHSRSARIRAFRAFQKASPEEKERLRQQLHQTTSGTQNGSYQTWTPVHLLSAEEVKSLFKDVVEGLAFLHNKSILHLDLKPGNVLLTWDEGIMIPRAMLSDFGTSRDMINTSGVRSGNTGTLEYTAPESLPSPQTGLLRQVDSKADMWSLGMILHKLLFFKLPYKYAANGDASGDAAKSGRGSVKDEAEKMDRLEEEVLSYSGFKKTTELGTAFLTRRLPSSFLYLLESLLNPRPALRPTCERVSSAIREGKFDPIDNFRRQGRTTGYAEENATNSLVSIHAVNVQRVRAHSQPPPIRQSPQIPGGELYINGAVSGDTFSSESWKTEEDDGGVLGEVYDAMSGEEDEDEDEDLLYHDARGDTLPYPPSRQSSGDKVPLLSLPAPPDVVRDEDIRNRSGAMESGIVELSATQWLMQIIRSDDVYVEGMRRLGSGPKFYWSRQVWMRTTKSCILVVKVLNLFTMCQEPSQRGTVISAIVLVLAVVDTWFESVWVSVVFGVVHFGVIRLACFMGRCCT